MAHHTDPELLNHILQPLTEQGHDGFAEGLRLLVNEAMRLERHHVLQAQPYERTDTRQGYANGYKPKTLARRVGPITFSIAQVRGETAFHPSALEKGLRSEQALILALAEMYVQGVSTRKVSAIVEELCGTVVRSTRVSDSAKRLDAKLPKWRGRRTGTGPAALHPTGGGAALGAGETGLGAAGPTPAPDSLGPSGNSPPAPRDEVKTVVETF
jgi:transposase-like protein